MLDIKEIEKQIEGILYHNCATQSDKIRQIAELVRSTAVVYAINNNELTLQ